MDKQTKEWKKFIAWRKNKLKRICQSKTFKKLDEDFNTNFEKMIKNTEIKKITSKFLWWEYESVDYLGTELGFMETDFLMNISNGILELQNLMLSEVPEETYENFLNWKVGLYD